MAFVGYARVSSFGQNYASQIDSLKKFGCKKIFAEKKSGANQKERPVFNECMEYLREDDTLIVTRIDRLTRSICDLQNLLHDLKARQINLKAIEQPIDTGSASGKFFLDILGVFAEFENNLRRERQIEGIQRAKKAGKYKGRKPTARLLSNEVLNLVNQNFTRVAIAKKLNIGIASIYRILKTHKLAKPKENLLGSQASKKIAVIDVWLRVENNSKFVRGKNESRKMIETSCFSRFDMVKKHKDSLDYVLKIPYENDQSLDETVNWLIDEASKIASLRNDFVEMTVVEPATEKSW